MFLLYIIQSYSMQLGRQCNIKLVIQFNMICIKNLGILSCGISLVPSTERVSSEYVKAHKILKF